MVVHIPVLVIYPYTIIYHVYSRSYAAVIQVIYHLFLVELSSIDNFELFVIDLLMYVNM